MCLCLKRVYATHYPDSSSGARFNLPPLIGTKSAIGSIAQQITGIVVSDSGPMIVNEEPAVHTLMTWIEGLRSVILVAHSGRRYYFPVLISTLTRLDVILMFFGCVKDYIDSIQVLR